MHSPWFAAIVLVVAAQVCSTSAASAQSGLKFGTYFTDSGAVLELDKKGGTFLGGRLLKIGQPNDDPITIVGENPRDGTLKLNFYKGGKILDTINYSRTATKEPSAFGSQVYTHWNAQEGASNEDLSKYGLDSFKSLIIGAADAPYSDLITSAKAPRMKPGVNFDVYARAQDQMNEYFNKAGITSLPITGTAPNPYGYITFSTSRTNAAYLSAAAAKMGLQPTALHIQTLDAENARVFVKPDDVVRLAGAGGAISIPPFLVTSSDVIKVPNPNLIRRYLTEFKLTEDDTKRLSNIYQAMGTKGCREELAKGGLIIVCDYFRDLFASDKALWYRTLISITMVASNETNYTLLSLSARSATANNTKTDYDNATKQFSPPRESVTEAETFVLQAFVKGVTREYPGTHR